MMISFLIEKEEQFRIFSDAQVQVKSKQAELITTIGLSDICGGSKGGHRRLRKNKQIRKSSFIKIWSPRLNKNL